MLTSIQKRSGFTIVELLIVIVVIAILAAISVVAYTGIQARARASTIAADFANNDKVAKLASASTGNPPATADIMQSSTKMTTAKGIYKLYTFCTSPSGYAQAAETLSGDTFYSLNGGAVTQNNSLDVANACAGLGIASASRIFLGMPSTSCAVQGGSCTFSGTASIAYGSPTTGGFTVIEDLTSPVTCNNTVFGDPAFGFQKWCYVLDYQ